MTRDHFVLTAILITLVLTAAIATAADAQETVVGDFNCDGVDDTAVGMPLETVDGVSGAGLVVVEYGAGAGLAAAAVEAFDFGASAEELAGRSADRTVYLADAEYGASLAVGEFDDDGCDDLAVGAPGFYQGLGAVDVLYGTPSGLVSDGPVALTQTEFRLNAHLGDGFGESLASGDFDGNGSDDLAIGAPWDGHGESGRVVVLYATEDGLDAADSQYWHQGATDEHGTVAGTPETDDHFGATVAADDLDGDGIDDLTIGVPGDGMDNTLYGRDGEGLTTLDNTLE